MSTQTGPLDESARAVAEVESESLTESGRVLERLTRGVGTPLSVSVCIGIALGWIALNVGLRAAGAAAPDPYPFSALATVATLAALIMTLLIFSAERRLSEAEQRRARLMLQLTVLTEQKTAKIIELLEALRRDDPQISHREDPHTSALTRPTDPVEALEALERSSEEVRRRGG